jgi:hypothetical protein
MEFIGFHQVYGMLFEEREENAFLRAVSIIEEQHLLPVKNTKRKFPPVVEFEFININVYLIFFQGGNRH